MFTVQVFFPFKVLVVGFILKSTSFNFVSEHYFFNGFIIMKLFLTK